MSRKAMPGRKPALSSHQQQRIVELSETEGFSFRQLAVMYGVSAMTICRIIKREATTEQRDGQAANQQQAVGHDMYPGIYNSYD